MNNMEKQEREELDVFKEFAAVCPLHLLPESARPGQNPPDVLCDSKSGETVAFELVSCEDLVPRKTSPGELNYKPIEQYRNYCGYIKVGVVERVSRKIEKKYESQSIALHLLAWSYTATASESENWREELTVLLSKSMGSFVRIWVFGRQAKEIAFDSDQDLTSRRPIISEPADEIVIL